MNKQFKHLKRNFSLNVIEGVAFFLGMIFISPENVLAVFIKRLGGSDTVISLIPVLSNIGVFFPSILIARYIRTKKRKKWIIIKFGFLQRIPWLLAGLISLFFASNHPAVAISSIMIAIFLTSLGAGFGIPAFFYFIAKTIPINMRGRLFALRNILSYLFGFALGGVISWILTVMEFPGNFSILIIAGFIILMFSLPAIGFMKEPDAKKIVPVTESFSDFLKKIPGIVRTNRNLKIYIWGRVFYTLAFTSLSYYAVNLMEKFSLHVSQVGIFTIITAAVFIMANPILGIISDKKGHLINHLIAAGILVFGNLLAMYSGSYILALGSIAAGAIAKCCTSVSVFTMAMEFGEEHEIPLYIGIIGIFIGFTSFAIIGIGILADLFGLNILFVISTFCAIVSLVFFLNMQEPRNHRSPSVMDLR